MNLIHHSQTQLCERWFPFLSQYSGIFSWDMFVLSSSSLTIPKVILFQDFCQPLFFITADKNLKIFQKPCYIFKLSSLFPLPILKILGSFFLESDIIKTVISIFSATIYKQVYIPQSVQCMLQVHDICHKNIK